MTPRRGAEWPVLVGYSLLGLVSLPLYEPATATLLCFAIGGVLSARTAGFAVPVRVRHAALALATITLCLATGAWFGDRLLARGVIERSPALLMDAAHFSHRPEQALQHASDLLVEE